MTIDIEKLAKEAELNIPSQTRGEVYVKLKAFAETYASEKQRQQEPVAKINAQWSCPDSFGKKHRERYVQFKFGIIPREGTELFTYPPDAAKMLEDKEREIAELKSTVKKWQENSVDLEYSCLDKNILITELQSNINDLREALEYWSKVINYQYSGSKEAMSFLQQADYMAEQALSKTPTQSLHEFENEVIERCAKVCDDASQPHQDEIHTDAQWAAKLLAANIRALKTNS